MWNVLSLLQKNGDVRDTPLRQIASSVGDAAIAAFSAGHYVENLNK